MRSYKTIALTWLAFALSAHAALSDIPITVQGIGPYYQLTLPITAYGLSRSGDLDELRVRNAAGEAVPFAWRRNDNVAHTSTTQQAPLYPLAITAEHDTTDGTLAFVILASGALQPVQQISPAKTTGKHWLIDASQINGRLLQAHFEIPATQFGLFTLDLEASDDLKHWHSIVNNEQLVRLQYEKQTIERLSVDLGGIQTRFLRLRWTDPQHPPHIVKVTIDSVEDTQPMPVVQWVDKVTAQHCGEDYCDYNVPNGAPLTSLKLQLAQTNTLALVRVYGITDAQTAQPLHRTHNPLYALRQQRNPRAHISPRETLLADGVVYRLNKPTGEITSQALQLNGSAWKTLRVRTNGEIRALGSTAPQLSLAVPLKTLVFLGQGKGPYSVGSTDSLDAQKLTGGTPIALSTLIPNYQPELLADIEQASVAQTAVSSISVIKTPKPPAKTTVNRKVWLWGALVAGLLLLAAMAWSLLNGLKNSTSQQSTPET